MPIVLLFILGCFSIGTLMILWKLRIQVTNVLEQLGCERVPSRLLVMADLASALLIGFGVVTAFSPLALYQWIHGNAKRYLWIISGPYPYSHFGGVLFQLWMYASLLAAAVLAIGMGFLMRLWFWAKVGEWVNGKGRVSHSERAA